MKISQDNMDNFMHKTKFSVYSIDALVGFKKLGMNCADYLLRKANSQIFDIHD